MDLVATIDVGVNNFAYAIFDANSNSNAPLTSEHVALNIPTSTCKDRIMKTYRGLYEFINGTGKKLFAAKTIIIEAQMNSNIACYTTQHFLAGFFSACGKTIRIISPRTICAYYKLPRKREPKKKATVAYVRGRLGSDLSAVFLDHLSHHKQRDTADAFIFFYYYKDKLQDQCSARAAELLERDYRRTRMSVGQISLERSPSPHKFLLPPIKKRKRSPMIQTSDTSQTRRRSQRLKKKINYSLSVSETTED